MGAWALQQARDLDWVIPAAWLVASEYLLGALLATSLRIPIAAPALEGFGITLVGMACAALGALFWQLWLCWRAGETRPARAIASKARRHRSHLLAVAFGCFLLGMHLPAYHQIKFAMPYIGGYWADPWLADIDAAIFFGDPWRLTHLLPVGKFIDEFYVSWFAVKSLTVFILLAAPPSRWKSVGLLSYFLIWALGSVLLHLLPSAGPIFYERLGYGDRFTDLETMPLAKLASDYLWDMRNAGVATIGSGMSAMPSLHVAFAVWIALVAHSARPWLRWAGIAFAATLWFGSVYLGWHYAVDGIAGGLLAVCSFKAAKWWIILRSKDAEFAPDRPARGGIEPPLTQ